MSETERPDGDPLAGALSLIGRQGRRLTDVERDVGGLKDAVGRADQLGARVTELAEMVADLAEDEAGGSGRSVRRGGRTLARARREPRLSGRSAPGLKK